MGADKAYDTADFVAECRNLNATPHVAQNETRRGGSALDARTTRYPGYAISQQKRKRIEESFGWLKTIALMRKAAPIVSSHLVILQKRNGDASTGWSTSPR